LSKIFKSVSLNDTPVVIITPDYTEFEQQPEPDADGEQDDFEAPPEVDHASLVSEILEQAKEQAAAITAEASRQAEQLRQSAYDAAFQQGYQEGLTRGNEAGFNQASQAIDDAVKRSQFILALTDKQTVQMQEEAERQIIELSLEIAGKILTREIAENEAVIMPVIKTALDKVRDQERISIRVCQQDYEQTLQAKPELQAWLNRDSVLTILPDESLTKGDCIIETPFGIVDARIDNQLSLIKSALRDILP
jgi:flagellar assembly protein FliH